MLSACSESELQLLAVRAINYSRHTIFEFTWAFTDFLTVLSFTSAAYLHHLFSCETCKDRTELDQKCCDVIVTDGTATGILGDIPEFQRWTKTLSCVRPEYRWSNAWRLSKEQTVFGFHSYISQKYFGTDEFKYHYLKNYWSTFMNMRALSLSVILYILLLESTKLKIKRCALWECVYGRAFM